MDDTIYNIKIVSGEESSVIKSSMITRVYYDPAANFAVISGYINFFEPIIYKRTMELINWAMKKEKYSSCFLSDLEISVIREEEILETIKIEKCEVLSYLESGKKGSGFQKFEIAVQGRENSIKSYYYLEEILNKQRHIVFKLSENDDKKVDDYFEDENYLCDNEININFKIIETGIGSYSGNIAVNIEEIESITLESRKTENFYKKIVSILRDGITLAESSDLK